MEKSHLDAVIRTTIVFSNNLGGPPLRFRVIFRNLAGKIDFRFAIENRSLL
jgi:hypothetical protein